MQTLSRLNRAYNGEHGKKDTTYILDFVNVPEDILAAFKSYYETAELSGVTDPEMVYDLRAKLDATGYYDENEVNRVVEAELNPRASQSELSAALEPVADRLLKRYKSAKNAQKIAIEKQEANAEREAKNEIEALTKFKKDIGSFLRVYAFLSQIFDYGNTAIEKRAIFFKRLLPLLEFGREREGVDLSKIVLTHHKLINKGKSNLQLETGEATKLKPLTDPGSGEVWDRERALLAEIIAKLNGLFEGDLTDDDQLVFVNHVLKGKLLESPTLIQQAKNNSKEQFANSPDLLTELLNAIMDALSAHTTMSKQALDSTKVQKTLLDILLGPAQLYEALRLRGVVAEDDDM